MKCALCVLGCVLVINCRAVVIPSPARIKGVGADCASETECRLGLTCTDNKCQPAGSLAQGERCDISAGCAEGLYCSAARTCDVAGAQLAGQVCHDSGDCAPSLFCGLNGMFPVCLPPGSGDIGAACTTSSDCLAGLGCAAGVCASGAPTISVPPFTGVDCPADSGAFRAYFEVPAENTALPDFFRLPFPSEARNQGDAGLNLAGFPRPPVGPMGDLIAQYVEVARTETGGAWGTNQAIVLRTSEAIKGETLKYNEALVNDPNGGGMIDPSTIFLVELQRVAPSETVTPDGPLGCDTESDPTKWQTAAVPGVVEWLVSPSRTPYVCQNSISFRLRTDSALKPNALYMFVLTTGVRSAADQAIQPDADLSALLSSGAPAPGDRLHRAWQCHGPARAVLSGGAPVASNRVASLALFRTQGAVDPASAVVRGVQNAPSDARPKITSLVKCQPGVVSPCAEASDPSRDCPNSSNAAYDEYHGKMTMPVMQVGSRPYALSAGYIEYTDGTATRRFPRPTPATDSAKVQGQEQVCFSVSVPKAGTGPVAGVVIYGHGTGGHFRSFTSESLVSDFAGASLAMLSFDQAMHGPRRGSTGSPATLYFNINNPQAMRDNALQGVADYVQVLATLKDITLGLTVFDSAIDTNLAGDLRSRLATAPRLFLGHSQGGQNGVPWVALTPGADLLGAVFSGTGGGLTQSLLNKVQPVDFRALLPTVLQDNGVGQFHPVLGLMQMVGERSDPINFGSVMNGRASLFPPATPASFAKSLFHVIGVADTFTPLRTSSDLWKVMRTPVFAVDETVEAMMLIGSFETSKGARTDALPLLSAVNGGVRCNCTQNGACSSATSNDFTAASVVYRPDSNEDGHFVLFENAKARAQTRSFLQTAAASANGFCAMGATAPLIPPQ